MTPKQIVEEWVRRFNAADADGLADLYSEDAVNHQVTQEPVIGRDAIRAMFKREFATADMTCIPEVIHEAGDVAALEWRDPLGLRGCGFFTVREGRIAFQRGAIGTSSRFCACTASRSSERGRVLEEPESFNRRALDLARSLGKTSFAEIGRDVNACWVGWPF